MGLKLFESRSCLQPNKPYGAEIPSSWKMWNFRGVGKRNLGKVYREYGETPEDAITGICTRYGVSPKDIQLLTK
jgi:hypothetical protein